LSISQSHFKFLQRVKQFYNISRLVSRQIWNVTKLILGCDSTGLLASWVLWMDEMFSVLE
jgi:hypothetical protein